LAVILTACLLLPELGLAEDGIGSNVHEPTVSPAEAEAIGQAEVMFEANPESAIQSLRTKVNADTSAAVDFALAALIARQGDFTASAASLKAMPLTEGAQ